MGVHEDILGSLRDWLILPAVGGGVVELAAASTKLAQHGVFRVPRTNLRPHVVIGFVSPGAPMMTEEIEQLDDGNMRVRQFMEGTLRIQAWGDPEESGQSYDVLVGIQLALSLFDGPVDLTLRSGIIDASALPAGEETIEETHYMDLRAYYALEGTMTSTVTPARRILISPNLVDQPVPNT